MTRPGVTAPLTPAAIAWESAALSQPIGGHQVTRYRAQVRALDPAVGPLELVIDEEACGGVYWEISHFRGGYIRRGDATTVADAKARIAATLRLVQNEIIGGAS